MIKVIDFHGSFTQSLLTSLLKCYSRVEIVDSATLDTHEILNGNPVGLIMTSYPGKPTTTMREIILNYSSQIPLLGLSSASLAIAEVYGGHIEPVKEIKYGKEEWINYSDDDLFAGLPNPFPAGNFYAFVVSSLELPSELQIVATTKHEIVMAIKHRTHPCYGLSFAVETLLTAQGDVILKNFVNICLYGKK